MLGIMSSYSWTTSLFIVGEVGLWNKLSLLRIIWFQQCSLRHRRRQRLLFGAGIITMVARGLSLATT